MNTKQVFRQVLLLTVMVIVGLALTLSIATGRLPAQAISSEAAQAAQGMSAGPSGDPESLATGTGLGATPAVPGRSVTMDAERNLTAGSIGSALDDPAAMGWYPLGTGVDFVVRSMAVSGTDVYVGGFFTSAGDCASGCNNIAKWDGTTWSALGTGVNGAVRAIAVSGTDVYAGGSFTSAGDCTSGCNHIAKWNGTTWSALGTGTADIVRTIAVTDTTVYVGGDFRAAGTCDTIEGCNFIAKWNGTSWSALGTGIGGPAVWALAVSGRDLYAGGFFTEAGSCNWLSGCNFIAKWNGTSWSPLGTGMGSTVLALAVNGGDLYAGGEFQEAGTCASAAGCNYVAKWDGTAWSALGSGMDWNVSTLAISSTVLYAGGDFGAAGTCTSAAGCNYIARWDGTAWSALGSGTDASVVALGIDDIDLYAGGDFETAGTCTSADGCNYIARCHIVPTPVVYADPAGACGSNTPCYASLQTAINTVDVDGQVRYYGGTYSESVSLGRRITVSFVGSSDVTIDGDLAIITGTLNAPMTYMLSLTGDLANSGGVFNHNNGAFVFAGSSTQTITGDFTFNDLTVDGGAALDVGENTLTVSGKGYAASMSQDVSTPATWVKFLGQTGVWLDSVDGSKPLGDAAISTRFLAAGTTSCVGGGQVTVRRCFGINPANTTGRSAVVRFYFDETRDLNGLTCADLKAYHYDGSDAWSLAGDAGGTPTCDGAASYVEVTGMTTFSAFVLANEDPSGVPTAVRLSSLAAHPVARAVGFALALVLGVGGALFLSSRRYARSRGSLL